MDFLGKDYAELPAQSAHYQSVRVGNMLFRSDAIPWDTEVEYRDIAAKTNVNLERMQLISGRLILED